VAKPGSATTTQIQKLLEERRKIEQWLQRLADAGDTAAAGVRDRVKGDYETRLVKVVEELQTYGDDIRSSLEKYQGHHAKLKQKEQVSSEELAEAELRYSVGEFGEDEWQERKSAIMGTLIDIREKLAGAEIEIGELEEVLEALEAPVATPEPRAPARRESVPSDIGADLGLRDLGGAVEEDETAAALEELAGSEPPSKQTDAFVDELAFLKSVTEDDQEGPAPSRASGKMRAIPDEPLAKAPAPSDVGAAGVESLSGQATVGKSRPSVMNQRTLKCGECGAMNLPTEWYCDRCGAELAAL
jgi:hypothetical protein